MHFEAELGLKDPSDILKAFKNGMPETIAPMLTARISQSRHSPQRWRRFRSEIYSHCRNIGYPQVFLTLNSSLYLDYGVRRIVYKAEYGLDLELDDNWSPSMSEWQELE